MLRNRNHIHEDIDEDGSWAISYGDLVTLLMSFFVIYFSADFKEHKQELIDTSLIDSITELKKVKNSDSNIDPSRFLKNINIKKMDHNNFLVFFKGLSFFNSGQTDLLPEAKLALKEVTNKIMPYLSEYKVIVYAYTDNTPVNRSKHRFRDNIELSALRSISILRELLTLEVPDHRIEITGRGILPEQALKFMDIDLADKNAIKSMQRTVAFVLKRSEKE